MKKLLLIVVVAISLTACGAGADTPEAIAKSWCDLQAKIKTAEGDAKYQLKKKQHELEKSVEEKHGEDKEFMKKVEEIADACDN